MMPTLELPTLTPYAWGWKLAVRLALGVRACDIDCAFKLLHTDFLHDHPLETRGAMINAKLLYRLKVCTWVPRLLGAIDRLGQEARRWQQTDCKRLKSPLRTSDAIGHRPCFSKMRDVYSK
jgi:hypothetical protein